jgi:hypothetical protein
LLTARAGVALAPTNASANATAPNFLGMPTSLLVSWRDR